MSTISCELSESVKMMMRVLGPRTKAAVGKGMLSTALRVRPMLVAATRSAEPASSNGGTGAFDTGYYARAWKAKRLPDGNLWMVHVFNLAPYAGVIEYGRRPGQKRPPAQVLVKWVQRKLGVPFPKSKGVAFVIARAIGQRGLKGRRILTSPSMESAMQTAMAEEVTKALIAAWKGH